jgi:hypothetical protein
VGLVPIGLGLVVLHHLLESLSEPYSPLLTTDLAAEERTLLTLIRVAVGQDAAAGTDTAVGAGVLRAESAAAATTTGAGNRDALGTVGKGDGATVAHDTVLSERVVTHTIPSLELIRV